MFDEPKSTSTATPVAPAMPKKEPEDIFAAVDKSAPPPPTPAPSMATTPLPVPPKPPMMASTPTSAPVSPSLQVDPPIVASHKMIKMGGIALGILILVGGGFALARFLKKPATVAPKTVTPSAPAPVETPVTPAPVETPVAPPDTDGDGLTDAEEATLGTTASSPDTDADGLSDFDEVRIYRSDPKNADTDGDGYKDGEEVKNGYSPTGPGRLFGAPPATP